MFGKLRPALKAWNWRGYAASYDLTVNRLIHCCNTERPLYVVPRMGDWSLDLKVGERLETSCVGNCELNQEANT